MILKMLPTSILGMEIPEPLPETGLTTSHPKIWNEAKHSSKTHVVKFHACLPFRDQIVLTAEVTLKLAVYYNVEHY